ncbi:MAG: right-handed parallel beta-helix repeat-containing protein [Pyrinomonadaceae bacterium]
MKQLIFIYRPLSAALLLIALLTRVTSQTIIQVRAGDNLQGKADSANCGDTLLTDRGAIFVTPGLEIPAFIGKKACVANPITVTTTGTLPASFETLPVAELRALNLPKIVSNTSTPAVELQAGSSGYRFVGIEILNDSRNKTIVNNGLVIAGVRHGSSPGITLATVPRNIVFDRVWVHSEEDGTDSETATCLRGFMLGAADFTITNSRVVVTGAFTPLSSGPGQSTQAILIEKGPGPYTITNNFLHAWFTTIFTGGGPQWITNQATVSNATLSQATLSNVNNLAVGDYIAFKVSGLACTSADPCVYGVARVTGISGNMVSHVGQRGLNNTGGNPLLSVPMTPGDAVWNGDLPKNVTITGNTFWKNPVVGALAGQRGFYGKGHLEFKAADGVLLERNDFSGFGAGFTITSRNQSDERSPGNNPWATVRNVLARNNRWTSTSPAGSGAVIGIQLSDNMATTVPGSNVVFENWLFENLGSPLLSIGGSSNVTFRHVTAIGGAPAGEANMIFAHAPNPNFRLENSLLQNNEYGLNCALGDRQVCFPNALVVGNVIIDNRSDSRKQDGPLTTRYPGNFIVGNLAKIRSNGWQLAADSPFKGKGTDGKDPGVDLGGPSPTPTAIPSPSPTPTPSPTPRRIPTPMPPPIVGRSLSSDLTRRVKQINDIEQAEELKLHRFEVQ